MPCYQQLSGFPEGVWSLVSGLHNILCPLCPAPARYNQCRQAGGAEALALTGGCTQWTLVTLGCIITRGR